MAVDKYTSRRFDIQKEDAIDFAVLEAIPFDYPGSATEVVYETEEFTCVCPWTGLPDFARLVIRYVPDRRNIAGARGKQHPSRFSPIIRPAFNGNRSRLQGKGWAENQGHCQIRERTGLSLTGILAFSFQILILLD